MNKMLIAKSAGAVVAAGLLVFAATAYHAPAPVAPVSVVQQADVVPQPTPAPTVTSEPAPVVAPAPAPVAPIAAPAPAPEPAYGQYPSGYAVPWLASSDPQNSAGGRWDITACASQSASTGADGKAYCV